MDQKDTQKDPRIHRQRDMENYLLALFRMVGHLTQLIHRKTTQRQGKGELASLKQATLTSEQGIDKIKSFPFICQQSAINSYSQSTSGFGTASLDIHPRTSLITKCVPCTKTNSQLGANCVKHKCQSGRQRLNPYSLQDKRRLTAFICGSMVTGTIVNMLTIGYDMCPKKPVTEK